MHFSFGNDGAYRVNGSPNAERCIVFQAEIFVLRRWILPRDHEHSETLLGQPFDQGILGRKIEDVVLHDPCRYDQDRFSVDLLCRWRILNEFDQPIAKDNFAWSHSKLFTDLKCFRADRFFAAQNPPPVLPEVGCAAEQIHSTLFNRRLEYFWIRQWEVHRREDVKELPRYKRGDVFMMFRHTLDICCRGVPPFLA